MLKIKRYIILTAVFIYSVTLTPHLKAGVFATITAGKVQINGIIINEGNISFVLTDYNLLKINSKYIITNVSGQTLHPLSIPEISSDTGYIKIRLDKYQENGFIKASEDSTINIGEKVIVANGTSEKECTITGVGINSFELNIPPGLNFTSGAAVLKNGKVTGVICHDENNIQINDRWTENRVIINSPTKIKALRITTRQSFYPLNTNYIKEHISAILKSDSFMPEYVNIINYWMIFPYRTFPEGYKTTPSLTPWLNEHNKYTKKYPAILKKTLKTPSDYKGLISNIMKNTIIRGNRLKAFATAEINQLKIKSKLSIITQNAEIRRRQWIQILKLLNSRIQTLNSVFPNDLKTLNRKLKEKTLKKKKRKAKTKKKIKQISEPINCSNIVIGTFSNQTNFLALRVEFHDETYAVSTLDIFLKNPLPFKLYSLKQNKYIQISDFEFSENSPLVKMKISHPQENILPFKIAPKSSKPEICFALDKDSALLHCQYTQTALLNKNMKINLNGGACLVDSKKRIISMAQRKNLFIKNSTLKNVKLINNSWKKINLKSFLNNADLLKKQIKNYSDLEFLFNSLHMYSFTDIPPNIAGTYRQWLIQHNANTHKKRIAGKVSSKNHFIKHNYKCLFYNEIIQLKSYIKNSLNKSSQPQYSIPYFQHNAQELNSKLKKLLSKIIAKEKDYLKKHPSARPTL